MKGRKEAKKVTKSNKQEKFMKKYGAVISVFVGIILSLGVVSLVFANEEQNQKKLCMMMGVIAKEVQIVRQTTGDDGPTVQRKLLQAKPKGNNLPLVLNLVKHVYETEEPDALAGDVGVRVVANCVRAGNGPADVTEEGVLL